MKRCPHLWITPASNPILYALQAPGLRHGATEQSTNSKSSEFFAKSKGVWFRLSGIYSSDLRTDTIHLCSQSTEQRAHHPPSIHTTTKARCNITMSTASAPPILDFAPFYGADSEAKSKLIEEIRKCCHYNGFFQITGHRVPLDLQRRVMACSRRFFDLTLEEKLQIDKSTRKSPFFWRFWLIIQIATRSTEATNFFDRRCWKWALAPN